MKDDRGEKLSKIDEGVGRLAFDEVDEGRWKDQQRRDALVLQSKTSKSPPVVNWIIKTATFLEPSSSYLSFLFYAWMQSKQRF